VDPHTSQDMPLEHWGKVPSIFQHVHSATFPRMLINGIHGSQPSHSAAAGLDMDGWCTVGS
jgi:hypothetical protein